MKSQDSKSRVNGQRSKVFIGLSGGVDSSVSAALLKQATPNNFEKLFGRPTPKGFRGYDVTGVFIKVWTPDFIECTWKEDRLDAMRVCAKLNIPFITLDLEKEYKKEVVDYMISEYKKGRTPNPDVMCNKYVKFGGFYNWAMKNGADFVATGHYARNALVKSVKSKVHKVSQENGASGLYRHYGPYRLLTGLDPNKDQSYFLWQIRKEQLPHILFPVGGMLKPEVRKLAKKFGLITADKKDSQGLCFLGKIDMKEFLKNYIKPKPGKVLNTRGEVIGAHDGAVFLTLGERHGFEITEHGTQNTDQKPYYVIAKDIKKNTITVSHDPKVGVGGDSKRVFEISNLNWLGPAPSDGAGFLARLRYRQPLQKIRIMNQESARPNVPESDRHGRGIRNGYKEKEKIPLMIRDSKFLILFESAQTGGAPGQSIVFYDGDQCLGGGIIK